MANGALAQQAGQLFGTGAVASFDAPSKEVSVLPGVDEIAPNPLQAASLAGTLTYTPPKQFVPSAIQADADSGGSSDFDAAPAFEQSIFVEPPSLGDKGQVTDLAEFSTLSQEAIVSLGLVGLSPLSLENTFSNLMNIQNLDITQTGIQTGINLAKSIDPAVAAALNIATGRTVDSLTAALQNPNIFGTPAAVMKGIQTLNDLLSLDFDKIAATPDRAVSSIQGLLDTFAGIIENPVQSLDAFMETAGQHLEGTRNNTVHSFNFQGVDVVSITKGRGKEATRQPVDPAMITSLLPGPMKFAPSILKGFTNLMASILPGPFSSIEEQFEADLDNMEQAQNGISIDMGEGIGLTAGPFGSVVSFNEVDIPGLGPMSFALDYERATATYDAPFGMGAQLDVQSAAINNTLGGLDPEEVDMVQDFVDAQIGPISEANAVARDIAMDYQAAFEELAYNNYVDELSLKDLSYTQNTEEFDQLVSAYAATMTAEQIGAVKTELDSTKISAVDLVAVDHLERFGARTAEGRMTLSEAKEARQKTKAEGERKKAMDAFNTAVKNAAGYGPGEYNSQDPSYGTLGLANAVMGITGKSTYTGTDQDMAVTAGLAAAAKGMGYNSFEDTDWETVATAVSEEEVGGYSTKSDFDAAVDEAFDETNAPDVDFVYDDPSGTVGYDDAEQDYDSYDDSDFDDF